MKTKANQSAAERNITMVALANIQPSGFNPRKRFDETSKDALFTFLLFYPFTFIG